MSSNIYINPDLSHMILYGYGCERDMKVCRFNLFYLFEPSFFRVFIVGVNTNFKVIKCLKKLL